MSLLLPAGGAMIILAFRCVQARTLIERVKFGADWTLHV